MIVKNRDQSMLKLEDILEMSCRVFIQWQKAMGCEHCRTDQQSMMILPMAAERLIALYEAACLTYGIIHLDSGMSRHGDGQVSSSSTSLHSRRASGIEKFSRQVMCLKSEMRLGTMELDGSNAALLVRFLLSRRLLKLCALLGDLKEMIEKLWHKDWAQQTDALKVCERSTTFIMDKVMVLIGEIR